MPKIDVVIGNPPYTNGIYLKHLSRAYEVSSRIVVFLQPMSWVHAQKPGQNSLKRRADLIKTAIGKHFISFLIVNGNKVFKTIKYGQVCGITFIDKTKTQEEVTVEDRTVNGGVTMSFPHALLINPLYINPDIFEPLKEKLWTYCQHSNIENLVNQYNGPFYVNLPLISGHVDETGKTDTFLKPDFYQLIYDIDKVVAPGPKNSKQTRWLSFSTHLEAQNCIDYLATSRLAKFCLMIVKTQQNLHRGELLYVPAFDFTKSWQDQELYHKLGVTNIESAIIYECTNAG